MWFTDFLSGLRGRTALLLLATIAALGAGGYFLYTELRDDEEPASAPAPPAVIREQGPSPGEAETRDLGFPAFATRNTTRVAGADPIADAAAVALAAFPSTGGLEGPAAVSLVDVGDWPGGIAAASLSAAPVDAPILLTESGELPDLTESALGALAPQGGDATGGSRVFLIGEAADPGGDRVQRISAGEPAVLAAEIERLRAKLTEAAPDHLLVVSADDPEFAMPAAAWAARSGDPVLFAGVRSAPKPTLEALARNKEVPVYVLGPESAIGKKAFDQIERAAPGAERIAASEPVANAIAFARFEAGGFGWNINDPGHGFVIASTTRSADAGAAAMLSAGGTWGPLLLTDDAERLPNALREYMLDVKPGYVEDPTRALYNHIWVIGDDEAISVGQQAQLDLLAEVVQVRSGSGDDVLGPVPGTPEKEGPG